MRKWIGAVMVSLLIATAVPSLSQGTAFQDVPANHWAAAAVNQLAQAGVFEGMGVNKAFFEGNRPMTRYQAAVALSRLIDYINRNPATPTAAAIRQVIQNDPALQDLLRGPAGPAGPQGPAGAPGQAGTPGQTTTGGTPVQVATQQDLETLRQLLAEFRSDIDLLRKDVNSLNDRVTAVEAAIPPLRVSIDGSVRFGIQGTELDFGGSDAEVTTDNRNIYIDNQIQADGDPTFAKDALKGSRYGVYIADINVDGQVSANVKGHATMRVVTPVSFADDPYGVSGGIGDIDGQVFDGQLAYAQFGTVPTYADTVQLWDWYAAFSGDILGCGVETTAGRFATRIGEGLLVDTNRQPLMGVAIDTKGPIAFGLDGSFIDRADSAVDPATAQDAYGYGYLGYGTKNFSVAGTYLFSGFENEKGYGFNAKANFFGFGLFGEWDKLVDNNVDSDSAWVVGANLLNNWKGLSLTGRYGEVGANYNPSYSILNPYSSVNAYDTDWADRPLFLSPYNVAHGWEGVLNYAFTKTWNFQARAYDGNRTDGSNADFVWTAMVKKNLTDNVSANLTYGQRELNGASENIDDMYKMLRFGVDFAL